MVNQCFEQSIFINATMANVEQCLTELELMHQWLNPLLKCEAIEPWDTQVGSRCRFLMKIPLIEPSLESVVKERQTGLIVWQFRGFFDGCDRWEWQSTQGGTLLINRFEFSIPHALIKFGFNLFASQLTKYEMKTQLKRLKKVAETLNHN